jgi:hypothetical protein
MKEADRWREAGSSDIGRNPPGRHSEGRIQHGVDRVARASLALGVEP